MRQINNIVVHTSATHRSADVLAIMKYWRNKLGWKNPGYHKIIDADGNVFRLLPDSEVANGVRGHNHDSLHICYIGGWDETDTRTPAQKMALERELRKWKYLYYDAKIKGHRDFEGVNKSCPCFNAIDEYKHL